STVVAQESLEGGGEGGGEIGAVAYGMAHKFWGDIAKDFFWKSKHSGDFLSYNFDVTKGEIFVKFMEGATTNICYNLLDRNVHEKNLGNKVAFYWEGNEPGDELTVTYRELLQRVCQFANVLKSQGVKKGDRVSIYMPMAVELVVAMLACVRIGAVHSIVFAGFSAESLCERIMDSECLLLITADGFYRGDKLINLKLLADDALQKCKDKGFTVRKCIMLKHLSKEIEEGSQSPPAKRSCPDLQVPWNPEVDLCWHTLVKGASDECEPEWCDSEDPLFILYTSGSTGKPKGVLHTVSGYMLYAPDDVYWCTADIGWITGHSYITYGPLANGATSVLFEGLPTYPDVGRMWEIVDKYHVTKFYTAPTAIRLLMKYGTEPVQKHKRDSLKVLGTVGEPINPEAWQWYYNVVGEKRCPIVDTFWQTETGGHVLTPLPGATPMKPGSATFPFFGVMPAILNESGEELEGPSEGYLVFKQPWPGIMRTVYGNQQRFETVYFKKFPGYYVTGDGRRTYLTVKTMKKMLINNVNTRHLLSTAEVESALVEHECVAEAAVVGRPHPVKGESLYCFVTLTEGASFCRTLEVELRNLVREKIGAIATPDYIQNAPGLPKTRSGKIMRRVLRKIASGERELGDISTLADSSVVEHLFQNRSCTA
uniref:Acetyl-coenzyme A synthetase n=1 Tax=Neogobius melanostomus TaxID=47308 RepID=A0A8C6T9J9_9GOBI